MKILRLLSSLTLVLIFTPFFDMCSEKPFFKFGLDKEESITEESTIEETDSIQPEVVTKEEMDSIQPEVATKGKGHSDENNFLLKIWETITVSGENSTTTGFGFLVLTLFSIFELSILDLWLGSIFIDISIVLAIIVLIRFLRGRFKYLSYILFANVVLLMAAFITGIVTLGFSGVRWGFYTYSFVSSLLWVKYLLWKYNKVTIPLSSGN